MSATSRRRVGPEPSVLDDLAAWVTDRTGLRFEGRQRDRMRSVLARHVTAAGDAGPDRVTAWLGERDRYAALVDELTVGETYFFRDRRQMELLQRHVLPDAGRRGGPVEVWSAGCSTGEEAYSVAILAAELGLGTRIRVVGTDISAGAVARARRGVYRRWALRAVDETRRRAWFEHADGGHRVRQPIRDRVRFEVANLLDGPSGRFDVVVCRNLLLYLSPEAIVRAGDVLAAGLRPDGWLVTGASDPPLADRRLERVQTPGGLAYRRATGSRSRVPHRERRGPQVEHGERRPGADRGRDRTARGAAAPAPTPPADLRPAAADPLDAEARYVAALLHLDDRSLAEAAEAARAALFLDPGLELAHFVLGRVEAARGNHAAAARSYRAAARALAARDPAEPVRCADGQAAGQLAAVAARLAELQEATGG